MPPPIPDSATEEFNGVSGRLNEAGKALTEAIKHIHQGGKTGTAKKLVENILPLIQLAVRNIGRAEVAYGKEQEKPATQPTLTDNVAIKLERLEKGMQEIKEAIKGQNTWASIAARPPQTRSPEEDARRITLDVFRKERNQYETTLDTKEAPDHVKAQITETSPATITKTLQGVINAHTSGPIKPILNGINKLTNGNIRLQFKTPEDAQSARDGRISWSLAYEGIKIHKPKYGVVVNRVPTEAINLNKDYQDTAKTWSEQNRGINIVRITTLRRKSKAAEEVPKHQSLVIFTEDKEAANHCIKFGFFIDHCKHRAERYVPHLHINQCFRCYGFGHKAATCKHEQKCGRCGDATHATHDCNRAQNPYCTN